MGQCKAMTPPAAASTSPSRTDGLAVPGERRLGPAVFQEVVVHLVRREIASTHRMTVLGWAWPVARQLAQLAALVFIFGSVIDLNIQHFPVFVFSGLVAWTWFSTGISNATVSLLDQRHLVFQPRFPRPVLPVVAVAVPLVDVVLALPVLLGLALFEHGLEWTVLAVPLLVVLQLVLMVGLSWIVSSASVFFRDVPNLVAVALQITFYLTPVFYGLRTVPAKYTAILYANPMTTIVEGWRAALLGEPWPGPLRFLYVAGLGVVLCVAGYLLFNRLSRRFVDSL
jgi:lipopolysaccharide transport system permease protein